MRPAVCRSVGCELPRRVRRGQVEPLCERCREAALDRVRRALDGETRARNPRVRPAASKA